MSPTLAWAQQLIEIGRVADTPNLGFGLFIAAVALSYMGRSDEARSLIDHLEQFCRRRPFGADGYMVNYSLGLACIETEPELAGRHFERALEAASALGSPSLTRIAIGDAMSVLIANAPVSEAAKAEREVIETTWDGRDLGVMAHHVVHAVIICARGGRYTDAARIDGWLGDRGRDLMPADLTRYQQAQNEIATQLGESTARLRAQGAHWEPAAAVEHVLITLRSISEGSPPA